MGSENKNWYYTVELAPGERTVGHDHINVAATRALLRGVDFSSVSCLDIGTQAAPAYAFEPGEMILTLDSVL